MSQGAMPWMTYEDNLDERMRKELRDYFAATKYARHLPGQGRRETFEETVGRCEDMHLFRFPRAEKEIRAAFELVYQSRVLPSMRSMQFAGNAILENNARMFNCVFTHCNRLRAMSEVFWLLLSGSGVAYSVQWHHVRQLPKLADRLDNTRRVTHVIADSIAGWAEAMQALLQSAVEGYVLHFDYRKIRPKGEPLITSGGKAPGPDGLRVALERIRRVLYTALGRQLRPIECHDIMCHASEAVCLGGTRRAALLCLFSPDDAEMRESKTGNWYEENLQRRRANNSAALLRSTMTKEMLRDTLYHSRAWGDPGVYISDNLDWGPNPCGEISLNPVFFKGNQRFVECAMCNLTETNATMFYSRQDMLEAVEAAAVIGTLQAAYTHFPYLSDISTKIAERDALLGVSMTGMLERPEIALNPDIQREAAALVLRTNERIAKLIGIRPAARATCVKPSGNSSMALGGISSGHHAHHSEMFVRRSEAFPDDVYYQRFREVNPHMCKEVDDNLHLIEWPLRPPRGALVKADTPAIEFLKMVRSTIENWVHPGTRPGAGSPGLHHNVSNTVLVKPDEWDDVVEFVWENKEWFSGVTTFGEDGEIRHPHAPFQAVRDFDDWQYWLNLRKNYRPVDYSDVYEERDTTNLQGEPACGPMGCVI